MISGLVQILLFQDIGELVGIQRESRSGAYASLAMGLHGVLGAVLIPLGARALMS